MLAPPTVIESAIRVRGLTKRYARTVAVNNLNLTIPQGQTFGLLGPNGAGKSSTIRTLVGLSEPDAGEIWILGERSDTPSLATKRRIGYVPELHRMYRWMRVEELLRFVASFYPTWDHALCEELIRVFDLPLNRKVRQLSKGMTSKLGLLLALAYRPDVLILDEPTSGLDPLVREEFLDGVLRTRLGDNRTVLFSSHHIDDVERIADVVGIMDGGQLVLCEEVASVRDRVKLIRAVIEDGSLPTSAPEQTLWERLDRSSEFLACLPPLRWHTLLSKGCVLVGFMACQVIAYWCLVRVADLLEHRSGTGTIADGSLGVAELSMILVGCSGVAWAASSMARAPTVPILLGLIAPALVLPLVELLLAALDVSVQLDQKRQFVDNALLLLGLAGFATGSIWYLIQHEE